MKKTLKHAAAAVAMLALPLVSACSQAEEGEQQTSETRDEGTLTLGSALGAQDDMDTLRSALTTSELSGLLDGPASYTLLAPNDPAFEKLGEAGSELLAEEQKPLLLALLRDHLLPGHLTPETIASAIDANGGPVTMTTLGEGEVTFAKQGDTLTVSLGDGDQATVVGTAIAANNGVVIPLDTVLRPAGGDQAQ
ncbi:fasciclin domain-containing protein [Qipengyuania sp. 6B39]|uniref:fasciclin domain-containing protein n=1 Tax=Qipengyuania proteolytica TaxID=2867239 RepID=UPI001C8A1959|nr:fasciclin domain-containing protein [Qipengyuania proteolytica]MBX7496663.1 fasciclin domain-containing protein [Qipengyuania proteolytica]